MGNDVKSKKKVKKEKEVKLKYLDEDTAKKIGERCLKIREDYNENRILSQREFATKLGITHSRVSQIEAGTVEMTLTELHAYQKATGYSFDYFMGKAKCKNADNEEICKRLGLTEESIKTLEIEALEANKNTKEIDCFNQMCKQSCYTLNYLLENDLKYGFFNNLGNFLLFKEKNKKLIEINQPITNDDFGYTMTIKQWETSTKITLDETLFNIKTDIEKETENKSKHSKKKK